MRSVKVLIAVLSIISSVTVAASDHQAGDSPFNPRAYLQKVVTCPALNRAENKTVNIDLRTSLPLLASVLRHVKEANLI